jgi:HEAT repeat protein
LYEPGNRLGLTSEAFVKPTTLVSLALLVGVFLGCSRLPKPAEDLAGLIHELKHGYDAARADAALALADKDGEALSAVPALQEALRDEYELVREYAAEALGQVRPGARAAVPALTNALKDAVADVRQAAAKAGAR